MNTHFSKSDNSVLRGILHASDDVVSEDVFNGGERDRDVYQDRIYRHLYRYPNIYL